MKLFYLVFFILICFACNSVKFEQSINDHRIEYKEKFNTVDYSPLSGSQIDSMDFFKPNKSFSVEAKVTLNQDPKDFEITTSSGSQKTYINYAKLNFELKGKSIELDLLRSVRLMAMPEYKDYLFLAFYDETNGETTYGGGRYIDLYTTDINDGNITIDFNKAYNPYCAYSDGYNCPIPPANNAIPLKIEAGEKMYLGTYIGDDH